MLIGLKFLAGLGTIFIFIGYFLFKEALTQKPVNDLHDRRHQSPTKKYGKNYQLILGTLCIILGFALIAKALKLL